MCFQEIKRSCYIGKTNVIISPHPRRCCLTDEQITCHFHTWTLILWFRIDYQFSVGVFGVGEGPIEIMENYTSSPQGLIIWPIFCLCRQSEHLSQSSKVLQLLRPAARKIIWNQELDDLCGRIDSLQRYKEKKTSSPNHSNHTFSINLSCSGLMLISVSQLEFSAHMFTTC